MYNEFVKKKTRKAKNISGKAPCQICGETCYLDTHHIEGREIPNADHPSNLVDLCPNCHRKVHCADIIIEQWVMTFDGKELIWRTKDGESFTGYDSEVHLFKPKNS